MMELVNMLDLGSNSIRFAGSTPATRIYERLYTIYAYGPHGEYNLNG